MKLLSLNIWGGKEYSELMTFLENHLEDVDIFCLQEVFDTKEHMLYSHDLRADIWQELSNLFLDFHKFYYPSTRGFDFEGKVDYDLTTGLGIFIKRSQEIDADGDFFTYKSRFAPTEDATDVPVNLQYAVLGKSKKLLICNFHGKWYPGDKLDTPIRIKQSERILNFLEKHNMPKIICGDFNLLPDTKSIKLLDHKLRDLIKEFDIKTTRSNIDPYRNTPLAQNYADYVFVSEDVKVVDFKVPEVEVSDHLPMLLEFEW